MNNALTELEVEFARLEFGEDYSNLLPQVAAKALADGVSSPSLNYLAGLPSLTDASQTRELFEAAANELGFPDPWNSSGRLRLVFVVLRLMVDGHLSPFEGGSMLRTNYRRNYHTDYWPEFEIIQGYAAEWEDLPEQRSAIEEGILEEARALLANHVTS